MAETVPFKYRAFLSYSHRDKAWGDWLQRALEGYRIDKDLVGRQTPAGPVPKTLGPIFRDRDNFSAGHSLTEQTIAALEASQFLLVLCSPNAAQSQYVNEEIRRFKAMGGGARVVPVIVDGEPGVAERECFPAALRVKLAADGTLTGEPEEPIAADAREQGDGKEIAKQKVVAGLLGLGLDEVVRRSERARKRKNRFWGALAGGFLVLAIAASGSAAYAWQQLTTNEAFLNATLKRATEIIDEAVAQAEKYNVPRTATLSLLVKAEGLFDDMAQYSRPTPELRYRKAWMLIEFARNYEILGDSGKQFARANEAQRLLAGLVAEKADDLTYQRDLSVAYTSVGDVLVAQGNLAEALKSFRDGLAIRERLAKADPSNAGWQRDLSESYIKVGDMLVAQGNLPEALKFFRDGLAIAERLAKADPNNAGRQRDLMVSYDRVGDVLVAQGNLAEALKSFRDGFTIMERLARADPNNAGWQSDLSVSYNKVGYMLVAQGNLAEALKSFRDGLAIRERLAKADPNNASWQSDLSGSYIKVGDMLKAQGNLPESLKSFRDGLTIMERLAKADPNNAGWQRELAVPYDRVGEVLVAQGNLPEALKSFRDGLAIRERLAKVDPNNAGWQRDLTLSYERIGYMLVAQGNLPEALKSFRDGLAIRERLAKADPNNARWQRDLSVSYHEVGDVLVAQGNLPDALKSFRDSLAIMERLAHADPNNAGWQRDLTVPYDRVGDVLWRQGNLPEALKSFRDGLAVRERLAHADPNNAGWQRDLSVSYNKVGEVLLAQGNLLTPGNLPEALKSFRDGLAITECLTRADPSNVQWRNDLQVTIDRIGGLAFRFLLAGDFSNALDAADQVVTLAPDRLWLHGNRAHALMFLGHVEEARTLYLAHRGAKNVAGEKAWETVVTEDFGELRAVKLMHPLMDEIEKLFTAPP